MKREKRERGKWEIKNKGERMKERKQMHKCHRTDSPGRGLSWPATAAILASCSSLLRFWMAVRAESISIGPHASWACTTEQRYTPCSLTLWCCSNFSGKNLNTAATQIVRGKNKKKTHQVWRSSWNVEECFRHLSRADVFLGECNFLTYEMSVVTVQQVFSHPNGTHLSGLTGTTQ